jgi:hypothetical protein
LTRFFDTSGDGGLEGNNVLQLILDEERGEECSSQSNHTVHAKPRPLTSHLVSPKTPCAEPVAWNHSENDRTPFSQPYGLLIGFARDLGIFR